MKNAKKDIKKDFNDITSYEYLEYALEKNDGFKDIDKLKMINWFKFHKKNSFNIKCGYTSGKLCS